MYIFYLFTICAHCRFVSITMFWVILLYWWFNGLTFLSASFWFYSFSPKQQSGLSMEWTLFSTPSGRSGQICWMWWASNVSLKFIMTNAKKRKRGIKRGTHCKRDMKDLHQECTFVFVFIKKLFLSFLRSLKSQPLLQPHISHQLSSTRPSPRCRCTLGLLVPLHVLGRLLLPVACCVRPFLLASTSHALCPVLPLHPAEVWGWPWACGAPAVLHHGGVLHDGTCGNILASGRRGRFPGRKNRPPGHSDQAA